MLVPVVEVLVDIAGLVNDCSMNCEPVEIIAVKTVIAG
jgi:hypothetical protein